MIIAANGSTTTTEEAAVYVRDLDMFVTVQLSKDPLAVLSSGKNCEDNVYSNDWKEGQSPTLTPDGKNIDWNSKNCVPMVVPGAEAMQKQQGDPTPTASGDREQHIPDWLEPFTEGLAEGES